MKLRIEPVAAPLAGECAPPGDKSISHRAAIFGGLASGTTRISGFLEAEDTLATLAAMQALGAQVERDGDRIAISGGTLNVPANALDFGNSGTGIRLMTGALCGHPDLIGQRITLVGDESLSKRPMRRIIEPLTQMGAHIASTDGRAPLILHPSPLTGIRYAPKVASAQVKSALLLAGLQARGETRILEPGPSRDHTERLLPAFGVEIDRSGLESALRGPCSLAGTRLSVPGDLSSAAFLIAAAALVPGSRLRIGPVGVNPSRDGFLRVLEQMTGSPVVATPDPEAAAGAEPVAWLEVQAPQRLVGCDIPESWVPLAIDEFPVIMALAACARGVTEIRGAAELRVKESDRLAVMSEQLRRLGVRVDERPDGASVHGGKISGGSVDASGDHRIAMSLAVVGLVAEAPLEIHGAEWIRTSYPGFVDDYNRIGGRAQWR